MHCPRCWEHGTEQESGSQETYPLVERNMLSKQTNKEYHAVKCAMKKIKEGNKTVTGSYFYLAVTEDLSRGATDRKSVV